MPFALTLIVPALLLITIVLFIDRRIKNIKQRRLDVLRKTWHQIKTERFDFDRICKHSEIVNTKHFHSLSDQTLHDIDFYNLFSFVDRTASRIGQQYLFRKLLHPTNDIKSLESFSNHSRYFLKNAELREHIQLELNRLNHTDAYYVTVLLQENLITKPSWLKYTFLSTLLNFVLAAISPWYPIALITMIIPLGVNMMIHYWNKNNTFQFIKSFPQLGILIEVSINLSKIDTVIKSDSVIKSITSLKRFRSKMTFLSLGQDKGLKDELFNIGAYL